MKTLLGEGCDINAQSLDGATIANADITVTDLRRLTLSLSLFPSRDKTTKLGERRRRRRRRGGDECQ